MLKIAPKGEGPSVADRGLSDEIGPRKIRLLLSMLVGMSTLLTAPSPIFDPENRFQFLERS